MIEEKKRIKELLNVYRFEQVEDQFEMYTEFTVVAKDVDTAWNQIEGLFKAGGRLSRYSCDFVKDRSKYEVTELDLFEPTTSAHYSCGQT